jgi:polysaccharide export outer membrane protein
MCAPAFKESENSLSYLIGPGDVLAISIWKDTELSRTMPVRPDGKISLPVLGELQAAGLSALQLQTQICERLVDYVRNPQVNVIVAEIKSRTFNVVGRVLKAGSFDLVKPTTVLDAIAAAGGFQEFARQTKVYVLRNEPDSPTLIFPFNYKQVIRGRRPDENVQLRPGDTVVVP